MYERLEFKSFRDAVAYGAYRGDVFGAAAPAQLLEEEHLAVGVGRGLRGVEVFYSGFTEKLRDEVFEDGFIEVIEKADAWLKELKARRGS